MGGEVFVVVVSIGDINFYHLDRVVTKEERKEELRHALNYLGVTGFCTLLTTMNPNGYHAYQEYHLCP